MARHGRGLRRMKPSPPLMHSSANFLALIGQRKDPTADVHHGFSVPPEDKVLLRWPLLSVYPRTLSMLG